MLASRSPTARLTAAGLLILGLLACVLAALPAAARAADPIMPLADVRPGMRCSALSVVRGVDPVAFDAEVIDVVTGSGAAPRILLELSGAAIAGTGVGLGFSGSPVYCSDGAGVARVIGAISEGIGEYGGRVALATPIEAVLGVPVESPVDAGPIPGPTVPLSGALVVSGLHPRLARAVNALAKRSGTSLQALPGGAQPTFPARPPAPGTAMAVSLAAGDIALGGIGTVTYVDGDRLWGFGHELDGLGRRSLLMQDAYVYRVVNNPLALGDLANTYKLAAPGRVIGEITGDELSGVSGRIGATPPTVPIRLDVRDVDRDVTRELRVTAADESSVGDPAGVSPVSIAAPLVVAQGATGVLDSAPRRLAGTLCVRIRVREIDKPLAFCNRYVSEDASLGFFGLESVVASAAAGDVNRALTMLDEFTYASLRVESVSASLELDRGPALELLREVELPARVRAGQRMSVRLTTQVPRGPLKRRSFTVRLPRDVEPGRTRMTFTGPPADSGGFDEDILTLSAESDPALASGAGARAARVSIRREIDRVARRVRRIETWDGLRLRIAGREGTVRAFRDDDVRIAGRRSDTVRVVRSERRG